jgi:DNA-binding LacI/PurR family transcriptional regulator
VEQSGRPSLKDVARAVGVSYQTVSRVVNGGPRVSAQTRERVQAAIDQLGYRPNGAARALVTDKTATIGVLADASQRLGPISTLAAVEQAARLVGYEVLVTMLTQPDAALAAQAFRRFAERRVEGIVVIAPRMPMATVLKDCRVDVPAVLLAPGEVSHDGFAVFYEDQRAGARLAVRHLIEQGHHRIAHLAGAQHWLDGQVRLRGYLEEIESADISPLPVIYGDWSGKSGYQAGQELLQRSLPTAVFAGSDLMALGLIRALYEHGLSVPGDVSVVGFDDAEFASQVYPPLTTVRQDFSAVGQRCLEILMTLIHGGTPEVAPALPRLIVRASTGHPRT